MRRALHGDAIKQAVADSSTFVLGGDIFDFRWSTLPSLQHTVDAALHWLDELAAVNRRCKLHFVLGNHDYNRQFLAALDRFSHDTENLEWHRTHLRLGESLFLHARPPGGMAGNELGFWQRHARSASEKEASGATRDGEL